ncbi:MAG: GWxTD domain-containing protein, partial [Bacteroidota bacterium]
EKNEKSKKIILDFEIKTRFKQKYILDIITTDINRDKGNQKLIYIDKRNEFTANNFLIINTEDDQPIFHDFIDTNIRFSIKSNNGYKKLYVSHYAKRFQLPGPPFSISPIKTYSIKPDTFYKVNWTDTTTFQLVSYGLYFFQTDTSQKQGVSICHFGRYYPEVKTPESLLEPVRYLTTSREFKEYLMFKDKKEAADNFWIKISGNPNRARELIRIYYTRVKYANLYFSCHTEGWRTDRGLMYLIFGPPSTIYKNDYQERWIYGSTQNMQSMSYTFRKVENPLSDNDFELNRSEIYKVTWYQAIETWRNGRAFSIH